MLRKILDRYCKKHDLAIITQKEQSNLGRYRAARGELKRTMDDYNALVEYVAHAMNKGQVFKFLQHKNIEYNKEITKENAAELLVTNLRKEFPKNDKNA